MSFIDYYKVERAYNQVFNRNIKPSDVVQVGTGVDLYRPSVKHYMQLEAQYGTGALNWLVNNLPFEMHLKDNARGIKYNYCGPGTQLQKRLARGDVGINQLDSACMQHDIAYHNNKTAEGRHPADLALAAAAESVASDPAATEDERSKANFVSSVMRGKLYFGAGADSGGTPQDIFPTLLDSVAGLFKYLERRKAEEDSKKIVISSQIPTNIGKKIYKYTPARPI